MFILATCAVLPLALAVLDFTVPTKPEVAIATAAPVVVAAPVVAAGTAAVDAIVLEVYKVPSMALVFTPNAVIAYALEAPAAVLPLTVAPNVVNPPVLLVTEL